MGWLARHLPGATDVEVPMLEVPQATGFSNETFLFDATWHDGDGDRRAELVLRAQPQVWAVFPEIDVIAQQYQTMKLLGEHTSVPVAPVRWAEPDTSVLGTPFFVMDRLRGKVPGDRPPYTTEGWWIDLAPAERGACHRAGIEAMASVNLVDHRSLGFGYLDRRQYGRPGRQQRLGYFENFWTWARADNPHPVADAAWERIRTNWPAEDEPEELCWGDARPGNQMYADGRVVAVMDWEMVAIANAVSDLGWWCFLQRFHTEGTGVPLPEGMLTREQTIAHWEHCVGREAQHVDFYELVAGFHFTLVMMRIVGMFKELDPSNYAPGADVYNPVSMLTAKMLGLQL